MKIICGLDRPSFFLSRMSWLPELWMYAATAPFYIMFLLKINKRTVPDLTCPYNYRHRMMTILFLLQAWHGYRWISSCRKSVFRFAVTDYMCLMQDAFPGIFFWIAIQALLFYCATETIFLLKVNRLEKKRWLGVIFFNKPIDRLGPYMCYGKNISYTE